TVIDANGCSASTSSVTVTEPAALSLSATIGNVSCSGGNSGSITTTVSGGTTPYTYLWSNSATTSNLSGLSAGTYSVTVTDNHGCTATGAYTLTGQAISSFTGTSTNVSCNGGSNGSITTTVSGGITPYTYLWNNSATTSNLSGLSAGTYSVTVTDSNGCSATGSYTITQPSAISISGTVTNASCYGNSNGSITTSVSGGTSSYSYVWSTGATTSGISGRTAGTYTVTVTDAHSCTAISNFTITQPSLVTSTITGSTAVLGGVTNTYTG